MTEKLAEEVIISIKNYQKQGIANEDELIHKLESDFAGYEINFDSFFEMMNTGVFKACFVMDGNQYPISNLNDNVVLQTAFRMHWIQVKGEEDYLKNFGPKKQKKWWYFK